MTKDGSRSPLRRLCIAAALAAMALLLTAGDWPTYLHDPQRTSANDETVLSPGNAATLVKRWTFATGGPIEASPIVVGGTVYIGSWDGYEYALDTITGALKWKTFLGITSVPGCVPQTAGVSSSATVQNGVVYVGGGSGYWYALSASTGAVLGRIFTGFGWQGRYNWSSPLIYNGYAYIDLASYGDCPLRQGLMLQINLGTHRLTHIFAVVPSGQTGGGLWSSPAVDPATNTIYVTSGNEGQEPPTSQPYSLALIALDAATLQVKGSWQIPASQNIGDSDFGATPTLFADAAGHQLVGAANKNGIFYAFARSNVSAGPVWEQPVADPGYGPQYGGGSISPAAFGAGMLFAAGGNHTINGTVYQGSVQALDPATGNIVWQVGTGGIVLGALVYENGLVVDAAGATVEVRNAANGAVLFSYATGGQLYASPSIAYGQIIEGSTDGTVYAFGLKA